ncbi:MAG: hypothetical protein Q9214_007043, partial [Letrouitia sp. 1 TL-2023]
LAVGPAHFVHDANSPLSSSGEHTLNGTCASEHTYAQHGLNAVGQATMRLREHVDVMNEVVLLPVVVVGVVIAVDVGVDPGHFEHEANSPVSSSGEHRANGTCASAQMYAQHGLKAVGQASVLRREQVEVSNDDDDDVGVVDGGGGGGGGGGVVVVVVTLEHLSHTLNSPLMSSGEQRKKGT